MDQLLSSIMNSQKTSTSPNSSPTTSATTADANALLSKQMTTSNKLNDLIDNAAKMVFCGPGSECEKKQVTDSLERKYLNAQLNVEIAPLQLESTKKNYYIYKDGRHYYNDLIEKELTKKVEIIANVITEKFNEEIENANIMNSYYNTIQNNSENTIELYNEYLKKNTELHALIKGSHGDVLTNDRKTFYETEAIDNSSMWQTVLLSVYYILIATYCLTLFLSPNNLSILKKILILIGLIIYPFIIHKIVVSLYNYFNNTLLKNTETNVYLNI